ncbi:amidase [Paenibacillus agricola]|uniref:Amidase n=1 Tax=Paenibacillus agricola TaxID=2716264 RepID=A0ABX0J975_9BACL|nr:amidase [Paenibacillus agricola]NHN31744.1 amidase [Paenibacillus agricola]
MVRDTPSTIKETAALIQSRQLSPVELLTDSLERISKYEPVLNTFICVMADEAMEQAKLAEMAIMSGNYKGLLHGIPLSIKDIIAYADVPMTNGSRVAPDHMPPYHATVTRKLIDAGAVVVGKAHLFEYAFLAAHPHYGWTKNPWDIKRITGGSSSGSAAGVQAGFVLGSIGTDTGGSIRMPASLCGVVGLKPTFGRVSRYGVTPLSMTLDHVGPLARTCVDAAILLQTMAGYDPKDESSYQELSWKGNQFLQLDSLQGKKLGIPNGYYYENLDPDVRLVIQQALKVMESLGAELIPVDLDKLLESRTASRLILSSEAYRYHKKDLEGGRSGYGAKLRLSLEMMGRQYSVEDYHQALMLREKMKMRFHALFNQVDAIITPTMSAVALSKIAHDNALPFSQPNFTSIANYVGLPAITIPAGFSSDHLPIGLQLIGAPFDEGGILTIGHVYEKSVQWHSEIPDETSWVVQEESTTWPDGKSI